MKSRHNLKKQRQIGMEISKDETNRTFVNRKKEYNRFYALKYAKLFLLISFKGVLQNV